MSKREKNRFKVTKELLKKLGKDIYDDLSRGQWPEILLKSRNISNIKYDLDLKQYILGDKTVSRLSNNVRHVKPFLQTLWLASFANRLIDKRLSSTLRDVYYSSEADGIKFKNQRESDDIVTDLETILESPREDFMILPEEKSAIFGDLTVEYTIKGYEGRRFNLTSSPDGIMIGSSLTTSKFVSTKAKRVIAIESGGMFTRLIEERAFEKFNTILIHTGGQAPRATRRMLRRLRYELDLPVYIFTDGDPWGMHIAMVIISGSANAAHIKGLTTPDAKWIGVQATDIIDYDLPSEPFNDKDRKRIKELEKDPRYKNKDWQKQIKVFKKIQKKAEQQAFSRHGLSYVVEKYLVDKFK
ncbi:MAG: DNA topoisomerase IV subunit A [Candidatus Ranarchaeia archaeon]